MTRGLFTQNEFSLHCRVSLGLSPPSIRLTLNWFLITDSASSPRGGRFQWGVGEEGKRKGRELGEVMGAVATREGRDSGVPQTQGGGPPERARVPP